MTNQKYVIEIELKFRIARDACATITIHSGTEVTVDTIEKLIEMLEAQKEAFPKKLESDRP